MRRSGGPPTLATMGRTGSTERTRGPAAATERRRRGRTLEERRQERREALLAAALEVFGTKGYAASSIEEICRRAYVSSRDFYAEFANREALLGALGEQLTLRIYRVLTEVEVDDGPDLERRRTHARIGGLVHVLVDDPRVARITIVESVGISEDHEARRRGAHRLYADWIRDYVRPELDAKGIEERQQRALTLALVGAVNELIVDWIHTRPDQRSDVDDLIDVITETASVLLLRSVG